MSTDPEYLAHKEWIGYVQPVGLVVSIPALLAAQAYVNRNIAPQHQKFLELLARDKHDEIVPQTPDFPTFTRDVLGWEPADLVAAPESLNVVLEAYDEVLAPTWCVKEFEPKEPTKPWMMLVRSYPAGTDLDANVATEARHWQASPQARMEHLLLKTDVPIGLLFNHTHLRLVYKPASENSGHATFPVAAMATVAGRPIFAALHMLLSAERLFSLPAKQRLPAILSESRKYQNVVSTKLSQQVLAALYELVRGFQAANAQAHGRMLDDVLRTDPNHVYAGLLTVLMRLVFVLFAEDRDLLSSDPIYAKYYSLTGLFERLREEAGRYTDTMQQRYGAWAQLLVLFRMIYDGAQRGKFHLPARKGYLFDPDQYPFLENRPQGTRRRPGELLSVPRVSDGVVYQVLQNLLILDGERLSYRSLDVEHIGGVYETMMGFNLEVAQGRSIAIKPTKSHGAPVTINLDELLTQKPAERTKWLKASADQTLTGEAAESLKNAHSTDDLLAALQRKIAHDATPNAVPADAMILQPSDERRRSGSHYTPRQLTKPIVETTLRPVLEQLGTNPRPEAILDLKVCDPAMGSGAFLVETCRQLGDHLVQAWHHHQCLPKLPPDEDERLHAQRLIAQRCLYGVDRNPMAVQLAKLSLWLATLAKEHPFTFLDHALKYGDSLVGLTKRQIVRFTWESTAPQPSAESTGKKPKRAKSTTLDLFADPIERAVRSVTGFRKRILDSRDVVSYEFLQQQLDLADEQLSRARLVGDLVIAAFFSASKDAARNDRLDELSQQLTTYLGPNGKITDRDPLTAALNTLKSGAHPVVPFHWHIEFPEVFDRDNSGFDAIVGNPPFAGKNTLINGNREGYLDWLKALHEESHGNADLVAHFFRRAFNVLRPQGCFGLIATNTIGQGDTRSTGLRWICTHGGTIFNARKRLKWPGMAAVVVSVVHVCRGALAGPFALDGREVPRITAYLFHTGNDNDPEKLTTNEGKSSKGFDIYGLGFIFDDNAAEGVSSPTSEMHSLVAKDARNAERIFPYIGGEEILNSPTISCTRHIINFGDLSEERARAWPDLMRIVETKVKPQRDTNNRDSYRNNWWQYAEKRPGMQAAIDGLSRVLVTARVGNAFAFDFIPRQWVMNEKVVVFALERDCDFCAFQSRAHETWVRFFSATLKDDLQYALSDCFETFPFPAGVAERAADDSAPTDNPHLTALETVGREYYEFRAALMVRNDEGLTKTYNRFHDPDERSAEIHKLRELHAAMDRAVLEAYGWHDLAATATCEFLLDYEDDEDEGDSAESRPSGRGRKKPWRYRWPDDFRDEVLARLLELNKQRAEEERLAGLAAEATERPAKKKASAKPKPRKPDSKQHDLFES